MDDSKTTERSPKLSLLSGGARLQFETAIVLVSIIPILAFLSLHYFGFVTIGRFHSEAWGVVVAALVIMCLGYVLLAKYPKTIIRLRQYLQEIASGEVPDAVDLLAQESDVAAIEESFNLIIEQMKKRITTIEEQHLELIEAERQRVMAESLCTACHHLGQPATAIACYLELLKRESLSELGQNNLSKCLAETNSLRDALGELQNVTEYHTELYCATPETQQETSRGIISVRGDRAAQSSKFGRKIGTILENFRKAHASLQGGYRNGAVVELNNEAICIVHEQNPQSPLEPVVQMILDGRGNHPPEPAMIDLMTDGSLSIERTINACDPIA